MAQYVHPVSEQCGGLSEGVMDSKAWYVFTMKMVGGKERLPGPGEWSKHRQ